MTFDGDDIPIRVLNAPNASPSDEARLQLQAAAAVLHQRAADAHAKGMFLEGQSVRVEQLADGVSDEDAIKVRNLFVEEGVLIVENVDFAVTAKGGES